MLCSIGKREKQEKASDTKERREKVDTMERKRRDRRQGTEWRESGREVLWSIEKGRGRSRR